MLKQKKLVVLILLAAVLLVAWMFVRGRPMAPQVSPSSNSGVVSHHSDATPSNQALQGILAGSSNSSERIEALTAAKQNTPDDTARHHILARLYDLLEREGTLAEYASHLEESIQGNASDLPRLQELVLLYQTPTLRDADRERLYLEQLVKYSSNPQVLKRLAYYEAKSGETKAAYDRASEAARINPARASAHRLDGAIYLKNAGDNERSVQICQQILDDPQARSRGLLYAGDHLVELQQKELALQAYRLAADRAKQENIRQRALLGTYRILAENAGLDSVRSEVAGLATNGVTPLIQRQAQKLLKEATE